MENLPADGYGSWTAQANEVTIRYRLSVFHDGVPASGVLFGAREGDVLRIEAFRAVAAGDPGRLETILRGDRSDTGLRGLCPVGWRSGQASLPAPERRIYNEYFPEPWQIVMMAQRPPTGPTFIVRGPGGFAFRPARRAAGLLLLALLGVEALQTEAAPESRRSKPEPRAEAADDLEAVLRQSRDLEEEVRRLRASLAARRAEAVTLELTLKELSSRVSQRRVFVLPSPPPQPAAAQQAPLVTVPPALPSAEPPPVVLPQPIPQPVRPAPASRTAETTKTPETRRPPQVRSGRLIWTGSLPRNRDLTIEGAAASTGTLMGQFPAGPARMIAALAELSAEGMVIYAVHSGDPRLSRPEPPGRDNGWNKTSYRWDPRRANQILVVETPSAQNRWNRVVLRTGDRPASVIVIDWELVP